MEFEAYLEQFPNGVFRVLAQARLAALSGTTLAGDARRATGMAVRSSQTCAGKPAGAACWMEISQQSGCYVWNPGLALGATVTWTGACAGSLAQRAGTLTWVWDGNRQTATGAP